MNRFSFFNLLVFSIFAASIGQARIVKEGSLSGSAIDVEKAITFNLEGATELIIGYKPKSKIMDSSKSAMIMTITIGGAGVEVTKTTTVPEEEAQALQLLAAIEKGIPNSRIFRSTGNPVVLITIGQRHRPSDQELNDLQQKVKDLISTELLQELGLLQVQHVEMSGDAR